MPSRTFPADFPAIPQTSRVYELDAAFISIAPNRVHPEIRNQATKVVAFNTVGELAVRFLAMEWGFRGEELRRLPQFHWIARRKAGGELRGTINP